MSAMVDGHYWESDDSYAHSTVTYNYNTDQHYIDIDSKKVEPLKNEIRYQLGITVGWPPAVGKYYFNNDGPYTKIYEGATGKVYGWAKNGIEDYFVSFSKNGFVEITELTKQYMKGNFEYVAAYTQGSDLIDTISVTNGEFYLRISVSGEPWNGPTK